MHFYSAGSSKQFQPRSVAPQFLSSPLEARMTVSRPSTAAPPHRNVAYQQLVQQKNSFMISMTIAFLVLYFLLPFLAGYNKPLMATKVMGNITFGYILAFLEFIMGWVMAWIYVNKAKTFDRLAEEAKQ